MRYLMLLCLAACVSPAPREYRDGPMSTRAPVFVAPGYTPAGTGLPPEYLPGAPESAVERSPHRRVLPPTKEPSMFSGDQPRSASEPWRNWPTTVLGVALPLLPGDEESVQQQIVRKCSYVISKISDEAEMKARLNALDQRAIGCLVADLNAYCAWENEQYLLGLVNKNQPPPDWLSTSMKRHKEGADQFKKKMCAGVDGAALAPLVRHSVARWPDVLRGTYAPN